MTEIAPTYPNIPVAVDRFLLDFTRPCQLPYVTSSGNAIVNGELERMWKWWCPILRYHPDICLEGLRKNTKKCSQDSRSPGRHLNPGPPHPTAMLPNLNQLHSLYDCMYLLMQRVCTVTVTGKVMWRTEYRVSYKVLACRDSLQCHDITANQ
jgi:hypothetical protein